MRGTEGPVTAITGVATDARDGNASLGAARWDAVVDFVLLVCNGPCWCGCFGDLPLAASDGGEAAAEDESVVGVSFAVVACIAGGNAVMSSGGEVTGCEAGSNLGVAFRYAAVHSMTVGGVVPLGVLEASLVMLLCNGELSSECSRAAPPCTFLWMLDVGIALGRLDPNPPPPPCDAMMGDRMSPSPMELTKLLLVGPISRRNAATAAAGSSPEDAETSASDRALVANGGKRTVA